MSVDEIRSKVSAMMPELLEELQALVRHGSCAFPGFPSEPVDAARHQVIEMLRNAGFDAEELDLEGGGYPAVWGEIPAPEGAPTVLLYGHYDVQPAPMEQGWVSDPFDPQVRDGRLYGRGAADDKSGVAIHAGTLRVFDGKPPVGVKLIIEGEEETLSHLEEYVEKHPDRFKADVMIIADMGNIVSGQPVLTTMLRGDVQCTVEVRTIEHPLHSGVFGGPVPDAFVALIRLLDSLWDENGNTVVPGLHMFDWEGAEYPEELIRKTAAVRPGVELVGDGSVATRLWSKPNVTVIGIDGPPSIAKAGNVLQPVAKAKLGMRIAPGADPQAELDKLMEYLRAHIPWGVEAVVEPVKASPGFIAPSGGSAMDAGHAALQSAYGTETSEVGSGGSIPLMKTLAEASPGAEFILLGAEDAVANIHGANESVDPDEIERMIVAQALLIERLAPSSGA